MVGPFATLLTAFALIAPSRIAPSLQLAPSLQPRILAAGPALAGDRVVWGEQRERLSVLRAWPDTSPLWQSRSSWFAGTLAGSPTLVAFSRSYDGCPSQPGLACPIETQTLVGPPRGSLRPVAPAEHCSAGGPSRRIAISGSLVAFLKLGCDSSAQRVTVHDGSRTVFEQRGAACCEVALGGSYLAWRSGNSVDVLDLRSHRLVYRVGPQPGEPIAAFDVRADGALALIFGPAPNGHATLAWRAPGAPGLHRLRLHAPLTPIGPSVRIVSDRIVFEAASGPSASQLSVADLRGHLQILARFSASVEQAGEIDATHNHVTWASRHITSTRVDCPPPGQGRPCRLLKSGTETIWLADLPSGARRPIARWTFTDAP